jgi:hypothetical protein
MDAGTRKLLCETMTEPWKVIMSAMTAGAALFAAGGALVKLFLS